MPGNALKREYGKPGNPVEKAEFRNFLGPSLFWGFEWGEEGATAGEGDLAALVHTVRLDRHNPAIRIFFGQPLFENRTLGVDGVPV